MSGIRHLAMLTAGAAIVALPFAGSAAWAGVARPAAPSATISSIDTLDGIACPTAKTCVAVGDNTLATGGKSVVINASTGAVRAWSGTVGNDDSLNAVACPTKSTCLAVADDAVVSVKASTGAMKVTDTPKAPKDGIVALGDIACANSSTCYAVGFEGPYTSSTAIVIRLSGSGKQLALMKGAGTGIGNIACPAANRCLIDTFNHGTTKIQILSGKHFGATHTVPAKTYIQRIACYKAEICYALAGKSGTSIASTDEAYPLNPKTGAVGKLIKLSGFNGEGIACPSASRCLVIGYTGLGASAEPGLVTIVHGKAGKITRPGPADASYSNIGCASAKACFAIGLEGSKGAIVTKL